MAGSISIRNLRNIKSLDFDIPDRGVHLLTAGNGAGKTSLLACLRRIGSSYAFQTHFPVSLVSTRLDNHSSGKIIYKINGDEVEYAYRGQRWTPRPRKNSKLLSVLGYPSVTFIGASAERITPRPEDFDPKGVRAASDYIKSSANEIFETHKFTQLRLANVIKGSWDDAFVLALGTKPETYHSERHFSLGELCILKLLKLLEKVPNNSLIIIDELEMALHPRAQVRLLEHLQSEAKSKKLTVIFSTHSVTLIKSAKRNQIIYLESLGDGHVKTIYGCFPTYALGNIASDEETLPDVMLYSEDVMARDMLHAFCEMYLRQRFNDPTEQPSVKIVPVGGFREVVMFLDRNRSVLPSQVSQIAILDNDVKEENLAEWRKNQNLTELQRFAKNSSKIEFLPFTPEVGLIDYISLETSRFENELKRRFQDNQIRISPLIADYDRSKTGKPRRQEAKRVYDKISDYLQMKTQKSADSTKENICGAFATLSWGLHSAAFQSLLGPIIK